jgi:hypothetical protein
MQALSQLSYTPEKRRNIKDGRGSCQRLFLLSGRLSKIKTSANEVFSLAEILIAGGAEFFVNRYFF